MVPKRVRTRSVSAAQIEVMWEALPFIPERVLGYEVCLQNLIHYHFLLKATNNLKTSLTFFLTVLLTRFKIINFIDNTRCMLKANNRETRTMKSSVFYFSILIICHFISLYIHMKY